MLFSNLYPVVLTLSTFLLEVQGQIFPQCIRNCIDSSQYSNCQVTDIACLCRAGRSSGSFLPDLATCMHNDCIDISVDIFLAPLKISCILAGAPLPDSAVEAAKATASILATQTTTTTATAVTTREFTRVIATTITTTEKGVTKTIVFPVTIERTKTVSGEPSTITKDATVTRTASVNQNVGSPPSSSSSSRLSSASSSSTSEEVTTTILTSTTVLGQAITSTIANTQSATTSGPGGRPASETNSAPFLDTNAAGKVTGAGSWLGLGVLAIIGVLWF